MKIPRGTPPVLSCQRGDVSAYFTVRAANPAQWERDALAAGIMTAARLPLEPHNCAVSPGTFEALDLESARARRDLADGPYLRARCSFPRGGVRVVTVSPRYCRGDLFWIRPGDSAGARKASRFTLEVIGVNVARLQDITEGSALACGAALVPDKLKETGTPRVWFARAHADWNANRWQWVVAFKTHRRNVDDLLAEWRAS